MVKIKNGRRSDAKRARTKDCLCPGNSEKASILRAERTRWQISGDWWVEVRTGGRRASKKRKLVLFTWIISHDRLAFEKSAVYLDWQLCFWVWLILLIRLHSSNLVEMFETPPLCRIPINCDHVILQSVFVYCDTRLYSVEWCWVLAYGERFVTSMGGKWWVRFSI